MALFYVETAHCLPGHLISCHVKKIYMLSIMKLSATEQASALRNGCSLNV